MQVDHWEAISTPCVFISGVLPFARRLICDLTSSDSEVLDSKLAPDPTTF